MTAIKQQPGFALIEVLIAIFVLMIGALGAAGMQMSALRTTQQSKFQTAAVELATEMAEKMRANSTAMKSGGNPFVGFDFRATSDASLSRPATLCYGAANCGSAELAKFDLYEWAQRIQQELPGGRALICRDGAAWNAGTHSLNWACAPPALGNAGLVIKVGWPARNPDGKFVNGDPASFSPALAIAVEPYVR